MDWVPPDRKFRLEQTWLECFRCLRCLLKPQQQAVGWPPCLTGQVLPQFWTCPLGSSGAVAWISTFPLEKASLGASWVRRKERTASFSLPRLQQQLIALSVASESSSCLLNGSHVKGKFLTPSWGFYPKSKQCRIGGFTSKANKQLKTLAVIESNDIFLFKNILSQDLTS